MRRRCSRRRWWCGVRRWRSNGPRGWRRRRRWRRCGGRRRLAHRGHCLRRCLGWLLGLSIGTQLLPGLRHDQRRGLRVRWSSGQMHRREGRRGKQQELKFCHDDLGPGKVMATRFRNKVCQRTLAINEQALGRIVASSKRELVFISGNAESGCAFVHCAFRRSSQMAVSHFPLRPFAAPWTGVRPGCREVDISSQSFKSKPVRFLHGRWYLGPRAPGRFFRRRLRRLSRLDRRILLRIDRHVARSGN